VNTGQSPAGPSPLQLDIECGAAAPNSGGNAEAWPFVPYLGREAFIFIELL
jgi:hypothetical protein